jgi:hypothetical protein
MTHGDRGVVVNLYIGIEAHTPTSDGMWLECVQTPLPHVMLTVTLKMARGQVGQWIRPVWLVKAGQDDFEDTMQELIPANSWLRGKSFLCTGWLSRLTFPRLVWFMSPRRQLGNWRTAV